MKSYDIIVIGSGGGLKIAGPAAEMGFKVALIEQGPMGGTCLNRGCIPSKMLIYPGHIANIMRDCGRYDITCAAPVTIDFASVTGEIIKQTSAISANIESRYAHLSNLDLFRGQARFLSNKVISVGDMEISGTRIFIATGSVPHIPKIEGLHGSPYMTSTDALKRRRLPQRMIVIGASYIALELGYAYAAYGCDVEFIVRSRVLRKMDADISKEFTTSFSKRHTIHYAIPESVRHSNDLFSVKCRKSSGELMELKSDAVLVAAGTDPATAELGLDRTDIDIDDRGFIRVDDFMQSSVDGIYALGDVVGNYMFRHTVNYEGEYLVRSVLKDETDAPLDYGPVPYAVFTDPEIAGVGMSENDLKAAGADYVVGKAGYPDSNPGMARRSETGFAKILINPESRLILGAHIVGEEASDMVHIIAAMMKKKGSLDDLLDMIFIHPALPEIVRDAARSLA